MSICECGGVGGFCVPPALPLKLREKSLQDHELLQLIYSVPEACVASFFPHAWIFAAFDSATSSAPPLLHPKGYHLPISSERRTAIMIMIFFHYQAENTWKKYKHLDCTNPKCSRYQWLVNMLRDNCQERQWLLDKVPHVRLVGPPVPNRSFETERCYHFVSHRHKMQFESMQAERQFFLGPLQTVLTYFQNHHYTVVEQPDCEDLVVYYNISGVVHYGRVSTIIEGQVTVSSKWGQFPIYEHRLDITDFDHGCEVLYLHADLKLS